MIWFFELLIDKLTADSAIKIAALVLGLLTFITERIVSHRRNRANLKNEWLINMIIKPQLEKINLFYLNTDEELNLAIKDLLQIKGLVNNAVINSTKVKYTSEFKLRRKANFNDFVSMLAAFDPDLSSEIDSILNQLDDFYVNSIDNVDSTYNSLRLYDNKSELYQILFGSIT